MRTLRATVLAASCVGLVACGSEEESGPGPNGEPPNVPGTEIWIDAGDGIDHGPMVSLEVSNNTTVEQTFSVQLTVEGIFQDGATVELSGNEFVSWVSEDETIATIGEVTDNGAEIVGMAAGKTNIVASIGALMAEQEFTVLPPALVAVELSASADEPALGSIENLTATARFRDGNTTDVTQMAEWTTSDADIVRILNDEGRKGIYIVQKRGAATVSATFDGIAGTKNFDLPCRIEESNVFVSGQVMPNVSWPAAVMYDVDGNRSTRALSMEDLMCDAAFDKYEAFIFSLNAGWCGPCHGWMQRVSDAEATLDEAGILPVFIVGQDTRQTAAGSDAADTQYADNLSDTHASDSASIRVGNADTVGAPDLPPEAAQFADRLYGMNQMVLTTGGWPTTFVVRRADMRLLDLTSNRTVGAAISVVEANSIGGGGGATNCADADVGDLEPNDTLDLAPIFRAGAVQAGVCTDGDVDFVRVKMDGPWRVTLSFSNSDADIDVYAWNEAESAILKDENGDSIFSAQLGSDSETLEMVGEQVLRIQAKDGTGAYTMTIEPI